jgi:hypothetical protein
MQSIHDDEPPHASFRASAQRWRQRAHHRRGHCGDCGGGGGGGHLAQRPALPSNRPPSAGAPPVACGAHPPPRSAHPRHAPTPAHRRTSTSPTPRRAPLSLRQRSLPVRRCQPQVSQGDCRAVRCRLGRCNGRPGPTHPTLGGGAPRRHAAATSVRSSVLDRQLRYTGSASAASSPLAAYPPSGQSAAPPDGGSVHLDGKDFFRQARLRLTYEQFNQAAEPTTPAHLRSLHRPCPSLLVRPDMTRVRVHVHAHAHVHVAGRPRERSPSPPPRSSSPTSSD